MILEQFIYIDYYTRSRRVVVINLGPLPPPLVSPADGTYLVLSEWQVELVPAESVGTGATVQTLAGIRAIRRVAATIEGDLSAAVQAWRMPNERRVFRFIRPRLVTPFLSALDRTEPRAAAARLQWAPAPFAGGVLRHQPSAFVARAIVATR